MKGPFATDAYYFAAPIAVALVISALIGWNVSLVVMTTLLVFVFYFFRNPERIAPEGDDLIISPADGKVVKIDTEYNSPDHPDGSICISIFLSVFNVHIQRAPIAGKVTAKKYNKGKFLAAWDHKASLDNEQTLLTLDTDIGPVGVKQIAGLIARRIATWPEVGDELKRGDRYGLIRFGSRVDLITSPDVEVVCQIGDTVKGGQTVMLRILEIGGTVKGGETVKLRNLKGEADE